MSEDRLIDPSTTDPAPARTGPRSIRGLIDRGASFADQGMQGAANIIVSALLARAVLKIEFASIGLMLGVYFFVLGLHRAYVVLPFILDGRGAPETQNRWWGFNGLFVGLVTGLLLAITLGFAAAASGHAAWGWIVEGLGFSVLVTPCLLMSEFARRWLYQAHRPIAPAMASSVYFVLNVGVAAVVFVLRAGAIFGIFSWIVAALGFGLVSVAVVTPGRVSLREALAVWTPHRRFSIWQMMTHLPYALYNNSVVILFGVFGGAAAVAAFTAARTLNSPITSIVAAVDLLDKPRAVRWLALDGIAGLKRSVRNTRRLLIGINGAYCALLIAFTPQVLHLAFGPGYVQYAPDVRWLAAAFFLMCLNQPSETILIVLKASKTMFVIRLSIGVAVVGAMALGSRLFGRVGCVQALAAVQVLNLVELWFAERWVANRNAETVRAPQISQDPS